MKRKAHQFWPWYKNTNGKLESFKNQLNCSSKVAILLGSERDSTGREVLAEDLSISHYDPT